MLQCLYFERRTAASSYVKSYANCTIQRICEQLCDPVLLVWHKVLATLFNAHSVLHQLFVVSFTVIGE
jgi:hypothetical protein